MSNTAAYSPRLAFAQVRVRALRAAQVSRLYVPLQYLLIDVMTTATCGLQNTYRCVVLQVSSYRITPPQPPRILERAPQPPPQPKPKPSAPPQQPPPPSHPPPPQLKTEVKPPVLAGTAVGSTSTSSQAHMSVRSPCVHCVV